MFNWVDAQKHQESDFIKRANELHSHAIFSDENTFAQISKTPFYEDLKLLKLVGGKGKATKTMFFLFNENNMVKINGDHSSIYDANKVGKLNLNKNNALEYTKFFLESLETPNGTFRVVEKIEDVLFTKEPEKQTVEQLKNKIQKAEITQKETSFEIKLCVTHANCLFKAKALLEKNGKLDLKDEELLVENVPSEPFQII